jgi:hypothetical protein
MGGEENSFDGDRGPWWWRSRSAPWQSHAKEQSARAGFPASETLAAPPGPVASLFPPVVARAPVVGGREQRRPSPTRAPGAPSPDATMRETAEAAAALAAACGHRAMVVAPACFCLPAPGPPSLPDAAESSCRLVLVAGAPSWALCLPRRAPLICGARRAAFGSMQISLPVAAPRPSCERNQIAFAFPLDPAC